MSPVTNRFQPVAPFTGAWIEIGAVDGLTSDTLVAPFTGAWIEIRTNHGQGLAYVTSHPSRVRGLKFPG